MDDVASVRSENANLRKIRIKLLQWEVKDCPLAPLTSVQHDAVELLTQAASGGSSEILSVLEDEKEIRQKYTPEIFSRSFQELQQLPSGIETTNDYLFWYDKVNSEIHDHADDVYLKYFQELEARNKECNNILKLIEISLKKLSDLKSEYDFVSNKTSSLNTASEKLIQEQKQLNEISEEIQKRLHYFTQTEQLSQRLQSPTLSIASDGFRDCLNKIDECLEYLRQNPDFKESSVYSLKYKHCLFKAVSLMRNYVTQVMSQATEQILAPKQSASLNEKSSSEAAFALYYGKFQSSAIKVKRVSAMVEERIGQSSEYEQLLSEIHHNYLTERANVMSPAVDKAIKELRGSNKGDHCTLVRSACAFLVHVCQDEHRLFFQFFSMPSEQLNSYMEGICTILYDSLRPYIIHINHLETLAEICSILRTEMLDEHVQQSPDSLEAFGKTAFQLLQDVQERLVFRAHLYLQSDILNYNPSGGDLSYPEKLEMMESIALSMQEPVFRRSDSRSSISSNVSSAIPDSDSVVSQTHGRFMNSPADLHGMWYPTVRRTLVCLSRLYRCVDRPIFQGLSQEALKYCIQSVSIAAGKIAAKKTRIDGELFEIKHLLILREQIAPFRVDFTVKETSLDFSKVKTAAFGLLQKRKQLFSLGSNNALLEFLLEGTPQVKEHLLDSRKDVDKQLKSVCEQFIKDAVQMFVGPLITFLEKAQALLSEAPKTDNKTAGAPKMNYNLRQSPWASPQQISSCIQESQRLIKNKLSSLQRSMQLYLCNKDTEFIIFRPIRNNIISTFVKLEQLLTTNGYSHDDMIITSCPSAEQVSILLSSASILAEGTISSNIRKLSAATEGSRKTSVEKKVSFDEAVPETLGEKEAT